MLSTCLLLQVTKYYTSMLDQKVVNVLETTLIFLFSNWFSILLMDRAMIIAIIYDNCKYCEIRNISYTFLIECIQSWLVQWWHCKYVKHKSPKMITTFFGDVDSLSDTRYTHLTKNSPAKNLYDENICHTYILSYVSLHMVAKCLSNQFSFQRHNVKLSRHT